VSELHAVLFDVDFTLAKPGPELGPDGYVRVGERLGLQLDASLYDESRARAIQNVKRHPELVHDEEIWIVFMAEIVRGMGGDEKRAYQCGRELSRAWSVSANFELYEDALPVLEELRRHELKIGLVSNTGRDLEEFIVHHGLDVDAAISSGAHGKVKPDPTIFLAVLRDLGVESAATTMVGDSIDDDVEGARQLGMSAFLLDRAATYPDFPDRLPDLYALPAALGLRPRAAPQ
jgi:HAD superfamily hydrolase (TIGR01549 family)